MALWRLFLASPEKSKSRGLVKRATSLEGEITTSVATLMGFLEALGSFF